MQRAGAQAEEHRQPRKREECDADAPRLSIASGTSRTANQLGTAIGISLLFATIGDAPEELESFRDGWSLLIIMTSLAGLISTGLSPRRRARVLEAAT